ncbi:ATP-binding cassette sub-family D member 3 [Galendromus occidentalis]|uniref:ATP-binding cassette sub-family D member 3 n=1 Tax=Galendromus occidentalis TaxID=34638 RepID=A0AAJ6VXR8_9ACAR|nr:ATP-binding cassette sub-family D member 3 [Galendromus occidentalis]
MAPTLSKQLLQNLSGLEKPAAVAAIATGIYIYSYSRFLRKQKASQDRDVVEVVFDKKETKKQKAYVDGRFLKQLGELFRIVCPGILSAEFGYMAMVALTLVGRTSCDIWMINNGTVIERAIISRNFTLFRQKLFEFILAMPTLSLINNLMKYGLNEINLRFRTRLSHHLYKQYLGGTTYYKMCNLDNRISNPDHLLTKDVEKFCSSLTDLYSNLSKPVLDIALYVRWLSVSIGAEAPGFMLLYLLFAGFLLTNMRRPVGKLTMDEQKLEGELHYVHSRLITNSEEIAFYSGNKKEKKTIDSTFHRLTNHLRTFLEYRFTLGMVDDIVAKYLATVVGYLLISRPFLGNKHIKLNHNMRLEEYYKSGRMLVKLAEAIGRVVLAGREMTRLAGYTARVSELNKVLKDVTRGQYVRGMVRDEREQSAKRLELIPGKGRIITQDNIIRFTMVPLVTPNGDLLIENLSFEVKAGRNVLVCGPNGCGKSSLFRILGELWPIFGGAVVKPSKDKLFYVPQKPYMTLGTLRDQVIYPDSKEDMEKKGFTDDMLGKLLDEVQLRYLLEREGGWDSVQDWLDILSGGEKQRIAMARLFYKKPQFAILDECTSAVSVDVEGAMYSYCRAVGITLFTVSHRKSLWKYHDYCLKMDGRGGYQFDEITPNTAEFGS